MNKMLVSIVLVISFPAFSEESEKSQQTPPLPTHCVHGYSGVFTTPTAYLANPASEGEFWGKPSVSATAAFLRHKDYQSYIVTENILRKIELGYALERIGLGDWPSEVRQAGFPSIDDEVFVHNFNVRYNVLAEGSMNCSWMPAVTVGSHFKWNEGLSTINRQLNGACDLLGADHTFGTEFSVTASKTVTDVLPNPMILSAGLRNSDAIHTGFLGFSGERKTTFEGSIIYFLTEKLMVAAEYRQKSNLLDECKSGGKHLIKAENDWWDICLGYVVNNRMTIAGGYANFGNVLNTREDNVWAFQVKYEF